MIRTDLSQVEAGVRLARPIMNERGTVWLKAGTQLTARYLALLQSRGITSIFIDEPAAADIQIRQAISDEVRGSATSAVAEVVDDLRPAIAATRMDGPAALAGWLGSGEARRLFRESASPGRVQSAATRLVADVLAASPSAALLAPKGYDEYVLGHAVDVATTAVTIGKLLHLSRHALLSLARGCLVMDIGLALVDPDILRKAAPLTSAERSAIQAHPQMGWQILRGIQPADILVNTIALQHHERQDGQGYPRGQRGNNRVHLSALDRDRGDIVLLAEIAAVADVYDALSSSRPQRPALTPDQVVATLRRIAGTHLNQAIVEEFLRHVPVYPIGLAVFVSGPGFGQYRGVVVRIRPDRLDRPIVRIFQDARGRAIDPFEIDLASAEHLAIRGAPLRAAA